MPEYNEEMRITVFPNDKGGNDKRPDYRGKLQISGKKYKVSLWNRQSQRGPFLSGSIEVDTGKPEQNQQAAPQRKPSKLDPEPYNLGTDVPF